jgi:hypothetical protein
MVKYWISRARKYPVNRCSIVVSLNIWSLELSVEGVKTKVNWYKQFPFRQFVRIPPMGKIHILLPSVSDIVDFATDKHFRGQVFIIMEESKKHS